MLCMWPIVSFSRSLFGVCSLLFVNVFRILSGTLQKQKYNTHEKQKHSKNSERCVANLFRRTDANQIGNPYGLAH